jgi:hypothetical protein
LVSWQGNGGFVEKRLSIVTNPNHRLILLISFLEVRNYPEILGFS